MSDTNVQKIQLESTLLLVPTQLELDQVSDRLTCEASICGFGPIASGIETSRLLSSARFKQVLLLGIAGSYDEGELPVGSATVFSRVGCYGVGAGQGSDFRTPSEIGFPQCRIGAKECFDELPLDQVVDKKVDGILPGKEQPKSNPDEVSESGRAMLLTVCSAASNLSQVKERRQKFPEAIAEDMEGFSVAMAAATFGLPTMVIRGISNVAGDRDHANWKIDSAMSSAVELLLTMIE